MTYKKVNGLTTKKINKFSVAAFAADYRTTNGAIAFNTTGSEIVDQFGKASKYRNRKFEDVWTDQSKLWAEDPEKALRFPFYLRLITRRTATRHGVMTHEVQRGQGLRDEVFKRLLWLSTFHPAVFKKNIWLLPFVGSWKDLWTLISMEECLLVNNKCNRLDRNVIFSLIAAGLCDESNRDLVIKYLPRIRADKKCNTADAKAKNDAAKELCKFLGITFKEYRQIKSSGAAHKFQRDMCSLNLEELNFKLFPGQALERFVSGKFLENHGLISKYMEWLDRTGSLNFNGFAFDLYRSFINDNKKGNKVIRELTFNKQFERLIETAGQGNAMTGNVLCAIDTSASMKEKVSPDSDISVMDVCKSLGIYFSELNTGAFHNQVAGFGAECRLHSLEGTFCDKVREIQKINAVGNTNFQSLIDLLVNIRLNNPSIPLEDFPKTLLVVSDMQFDPTHRDSVIIRSYSRYYVSNPEDYVDETFTEESNYDAAMRKLRTAFPEEFVSNFRIVWWALGEASLVPFQSTLNDENTYYLSGFDPAVISFITGRDEEQTEQAKLPRRQMGDVVNDVLNQEILCNLSVE